MSATVTLPRSIFKAADRARILAQAVGDPTGTVIEIGGMSIDLVALSMHEGRSLLDIVGRVGKLMDGGQHSNMEWVEAIGDDAPRIVALLQSTLRRSAFHGIDEPPAEDVAVFDEWFEAVPVREMLGTAVPAMLAANGVSGLQTDPRRAAPQAAAPSLDGISSTQPASS